MLVRFIRSWGVYNAGEVAGFDEETVRKLIKLGVVEILEVEKEIEKPPQDKMQGRQKTK